jgi:hypothetical protein
MVKNGQKWSKMEKWSNVKLKGRDLQCTEKKGQELSQLGKKPTGLSVRNK